MQPGNGGSLFPDTSNPYFTAGFGLLGVGAMLAGARSGLTRILSLVQRRYLTTIEVNSRDPAYRWLSLFLSKVTCFSGSHYSLATLNNVLKSTTNAPVGMLPAPGVHYFQWTGSWFKLERSRERGLVDSGAPFESLCLTCIGRNSPAMLQLVDSAMREGREWEDGRLQIYTAFAADWRPFGLPRRPRTLASIVLKENQMEFLLQDVAKFLSNRGWYEDRGVPYRRGYLLHGPPGCGKSSAIQGIAGQFGHGLAVLNLSDRSLSDDRLLHLLNNLPATVFLLLEDIDTVAPSRDNAIKSSNITLSGLLNAIDGVGAADERIIFMTSNNPASLDPALTRPGRIDQKIFIGNVDEGQARRMFLRFHDSPRDGKMVEEFARTASMLGLSPAAVQGILIDNSEDPDAALGCIRLTAQQAARPRKDPLPRDQQDWSAARD